MADVVKVTDEEQFTTIQCHQLIVTGEGIVDGDVLATEASISGTLHVSGDFNSDQLTVTGELDVDGRTIVTDATVSGAFRCSGKTDIEKMAVTGTGSLERLSINELVIKDRLRAREVKAKSIDF